MTTIRIRIKDAFTGQIITDNDIRVNDYSFEIMNDAHRMFEQAFPNCFVNMAVMFDSENLDGLGYGDFICGQPFNMKLDEKMVEGGFMSYEEYDAKWHSPIPHGNSNN